MHACVRVSVWCTEQRPAENPGYLVLSSSIPLPWDGPAIELGAGAGSQQSPATHCWTCLPHYWDGQHETMPGFLPRCRGFELRSSCFTTNVLTRGAISLSEQCKSYGSFYKRNQTWPDLCEPKRVLGDAGWFLMSCKYLKVPCHLQTHSYMSGTCLLQWRFYVLENIGKNMCG